MTDAQLQEWIIQAANQSTTMGPLQKLRVRRLMSSRLRRSARNEVLVRVKAEMLAEGVIDVTEEGVEMNLDLNGILAFIERLLPLILQLINLFS
jgi:hypothetical protein